MEKYLSFNMLVRKNNKKIKPVYYSYWVNTLLLLLFFFDKLHKQLVNLTL